LILGQQCGICGGQNNNGTGSKLVSPCYYHSTDAPYLFISLLWKSFNCDSWQHRETTRFLYITYRRHNFNTFPSKHSLPDTTSNYFWLATNFTSSGSNFFLSYFLQSLSRYYIRQPEEHYNFSPGCVPCKMASVTWWTNRMDYWSLSKETQKFT
jgi:hypothetical protein